MLKQADSPGNNLVADFWGCLAIALCCVAAFGMGLNLPIELVVPIFLVCAGRYLARGFHGRVYSFAGILLFALPFLHTVGFLFSDEYLFYPTYDITVSDQQNPELRAQLALMGLVGLCGLICGALTPTAHAMSVPNALTRRSVSSRKALSIAIVVTQAIALFFAFLDAPVESIFFAAYTEVSTRSNDIGLGSLFPLAFGFNLLGWLLYSEDTTTEQQNTLNLVVLASTTTVIVVFFQLLRGDREFVGLLIGLLFLADKHTNLYRKAFRLSGFVVGGFLILQFIGYFRSIAVDDADVLSAIWIYISSGEFFQGTWTAALLTPLATLGDFHFGTAKYLYGKTYVDYLLSLPPTPVAAWLEYERPITSTQGPALDVTYGIGGTNITVVPFLNFSMIGVLLQSYVVGLLLGSIDKFAYQGRPAWKILGFSVGVVLWGVMWYGEMYLLRALTTTFPILWVTWYLFLRRI